MTWGSYLLDVVMITVAMLLGFRMGKLAAWQKAVVMVRQLRRPWILAARKLREEKLELRVRAERAEEDLTRVRQTVERMMKSQQRRAGAWLKN
jgi:hypothetical protein